MQILTNILLSMVVAELGVLIFMIWNRLRDKEGDKEHQQVFALTNYSVWKYEGTWRVIEDRCQLGFHPGDPPSRPGAYPGEIVRKPATKNR